MTVDGGFAEAGVEAAKAELDAYPTSTDRKRAVFAIDTVESPAQSPARDSWLAAQLFGPSSSSNASSSSTLSRPRFVAMISS